ncbi:MAG: hypothetical protein ACR2GP_12030 [Burkholderiaceae bacterium]
MQVFWHALLGREDQRVRRKIGDLQTASHQLEVRRIHAVEWRVRAQPLDRQVDEASCKIGGGHIMRDGKLFQ